MPNLCSAPPVEILAWVWASMSGLTRTATGAVLPRRTARAFRASNSGRDSTLIWRMPETRAKASSRSVLPTPEKTILSGGTPARRARRSSPSLTTSAPQPRAARVLIPARLALDLTAKQMLAARPQSARAAAKTS